MAAALEGKALLGGMLAELVVGALAVLEGALAVVEGTLAVFGGSLGTLLEGAPVVFAGLLWEAFAVLPLHPES